MVRDATSNRSAENELEKGKWKKWVAKGAARLGREWGLLLMGSSAGPSLCFPPVIAGIPWGPLALHPALQWPKIMGRSKPAEIGGIQVAGV